MEFYKELEVLKSKGEIYDFEFEVEYIFYEKGIDWREKVIQAITHIPDFKIWLNQNEYIIVDTKGGGSRQHDEVSVIKRKIWMLLHPNIPYYMISKLPKYLSGLWAESSKGYDFTTKIRNKYKKLYPNENTRKKDCKKFLPKEWYYYYDFVNILGLFYVWERTLNKKEIEKRIKESV